MREARATRQNLGYLLAKASQRWNELLYEAFVGEGFGDVRPSYGSVLLPLFEEDGLRMGELASRARLSKQTITTLVRLGGERREDGRAYRIHPTPRARSFQPVAERALAGLDDRVASRLSPADRTILTESLKEVMLL